MATEADELERTVAAVLDALALLGVRMRDADGNRIRVSADLVTPRVRELLEKA